MIIKGSGGGGKSGGGSARVAVESPDSLRSKQLARVLDLVSEGEIGGLVNGLRSVYLNDTPIRNKNGTFNFQGIEFDSREGTQSQRYIRGFPAVEAETPVSVEIIKAVPVVRTITNTETDSVRVTLSVPSLKSQNTSNGDVKGTSVTIRIAIQDNGGGFVSQRLGVKSLSLSNSSTTQVSSLSEHISAASLNVAWTGDISPERQTTTWRIYYRVVGATTWISLKLGRISGVGTKVPQTEQVNYFGTQQTEVVSIFGLVQYDLASASSAHSVSFSPPSDDAYEFKIEQLTGTGTLTLSGSANGWTGIDRISGKTSGKYQRSYLLPLTGAGPWDIKVTRLNADSITAALQNKTFWDSFTEIVDSKFSYPNSALMALMIDSKQFNSIPTRGYEIDGMLIQIPSNYDPLTLVYTGTWDGTFVTAWSNNPAWCFYDLIINARYGLGQFISADQIDKWGLYVIAQYCDELVDDGLGGEEQRFTFNAYLQTAEDAYSAIQSLASAFRSLSFWAGGEVVAVQDSPKDPIALFTPANVQGGAFNYSGSSSKTRSTVALVTWNDPDDLYRQAIEYVDDPLGIARYGVNQTKVAAFGCTSRGQAHRFGRALLFSERMETDVISFKAGLDGLSIAPGDVIQTTDPIKAGARMGGRIESATSTVLTLDDDVTIDGSSTYTLWAVMPDGTVENSIVTTAASTTNIITVSPAFSDAPQDWSVWTLGASTLEPETWRVLSVTESDGVNAEITALEYRSDKYDEIEGGIILEPRISSILTTIPAVPVDLIAEEALYLINAALVGTRLTVSWTGVEQRYEIQWREENGNWATISTVSNSIDIQPVIAGTYEIKLISINTLGVRSDATVLSKVIYGLTLLPSDVSNFSLAAIAGSAIITWGGSDDLDVIVGGVINIRYTSDLISPSWSNAVDIGGIISGNSATAVLPLLTGSYLAKWIDSTGNQSENATIISTNAPDVINLNFVETVTEDPLFLGTKIDVAVNPEQNLTLDSIETIEEQLDLMSTWPRLSALGGISSFGTYMFDGSVDLGNIQTSRITADITSIGIDALDLISERDLVSTWSSVGGTLIDDVSGTMYIRTSDDGSSFGAWEPFIVGDYSARAFEFKIELISGSETHNILITDLSVSVDMPDRVETGDDIISSGITAISYSTPFIISPSIGITAQNMATGDYFEITSKTVSGFDLAFRDSTGTLISRTFDYQSRAY